MRQGLTIARFATIRRGLSILVIASGLILYLQVTPSDKEPERTQRRIGAQLLANKYVRNSTGLASYDIIQDKKDSYIPQSNRVKQNEIQSSYTVNNEHVLKQQKAALPKQNGLNVNSTNKSVKILKDNNDKAQKNYTVPHKQTQIKHTSAEQVLPQTQHDVKNLYKSINSLKGHIVHNKEEKRTRQHNAQEQSSATRKRWLLKESGGYVVYCPCVGRFGNQAEVLLGSLAFAKRINRTLLVPHFRHGPGHAYSEWFSLARLRKYHRVMEVSDFTSGPDAHLWNLHSQKMWCAPNKYYNCTQRFLENTFQEKYWRNMGFRFDGLSSFDSRLLRNPKEWKISYPASQYPLIALSNAPGRYPAFQQDREVQAFVTWSDTVLATVKNIVNESFKSQVYIGIHIRNNADWKTKCSEHESKKDFSIYACEEELNELKYKTMPHEVCFPADNSSLIVRQLRTLVKATRIWNVFVAAELDGTVTDIKAGLEDLNVTVARRKTENATEDPVTDLAVLTEATHFIGNCASSYSAFVTRHRRAKNRPCTHWAL